MQLQVDNANNVLLAGSYSQVHLQLPAIHAVILPVNTLVFRREGMQVATLDKESKVVFKSITIGNDFGDTVEVVAGVVPNETIILNPPDSLLNNQTVRVMAMRPSLMDKKTS